MLRLKLSFCAFLICCMAVPAIAQDAAPNNAANRPAPPPGGNARPCGTYTSVEQQEDGRLTFRLCAPNAMEVSVTSSDIPAIPFRGGLAMTRDEQGLWTATTADPVGPDTYRYDFRVDGVRVVDPLATTYSEERNGNNSTLEVRGPDGDYQTYNKDIPHGVVSTIDYWSSSLGAKRRAHIYVPPGYMSGSQKYPVLYLVHGAGDSDDSWTSVGHANYILDNLIAAGKAKPMIVVMPFGHTPDRPDARVNMLANADFGSDLFDDLMPYVESNFRVIADPEHRAMAGLSMGGAHTLQFGLPRSDKFRYIGIFSMGFLDEATITDYESRNAEALRRGAGLFKVIRYYIGKDDFLHDSVAPTMAVFDKYGLKVEFTESTGGHTWINWRRYLSDFAPYLFQ